MNTNKSYNYLNKKTTESFIPRKIDAAEKRQYVAVTLLFLGMFSIGGCIKHQAENPVPLIPQEVQYSKQAYYDTCRALGGQASECLRKAEYGKGYGSVENVH